MLESLKNIKTIQDLRVEKSRLKYEALIAESKLTDSLKAGGQVFTVFSVLNRLQGE